MQVYKSVIACGLALSLLAALPVALGGARTIVGTIKDPAGAPVAGLLVKAWDDDTGTDNDFMGEAVTDAQGNYSIGYRDGHWDPYPHNITKWRPDVFIKVFAKAGGDWVATWKSKVYEDHKLRDALTIDVGLDSNRWIRKTTKFNPAHHGLPFENQKWDVASVLGIRLFKAALCGGMSLTALETFRNGKKPPEFSQDLKDRLVKNQLRTVGPTTWAKFIEWQAKPTKPHTLSPHTIGHSTKGEWAKVRQAIDAGAPIILGLIRVQNATGRDVGDNHQVLAYGYEVNELTTEVRILVYDPNFDSATYATKGESMVTFVTGLAESQIKADQIYPGGAHEHTRGFFVIGDGSGPPNGAVYAPPTAGQPVAVPGVPRPKLPFGRRDIEDMNAEEVVPDAEAVQALAESLADWDALRDDKQAEFFLESVARAQDALRRAESTTQRGLQSEPSKEVQRALGELESLILRRGG